MKLNELLDQVDIERIYNHVKILQGVPRHPLKSLESLNRTAQYVFEELNSYGLITDYQQFSIEGFEEPFKNIYGLIGEEKKSEFLIGAHYDSVYESPGACDNLSGVSICLEVARILSMLENPPKVRIVAFTLEEGNPSILKKIHQLGKKYDIIDENLEYKTAKILQIDKIARKNRIKFWRKGKKFEEGIRFTLNQFKDQLNEKEIKYFEALINLYSKIPKNAYFIETSLIGSNQWANFAIKHNHDIRAVINIDTIGWITEKKHTATLSPFLSPIIKKYKASLLKGRSNYTLVLADKNSKEIFKKFVSVSKYPKVQLPHAAVRVPFTYKNISKYIPDMLRSDQAPFWRHGIPALQLTTPYEPDIYHTQADIAKNMDFEICMKTCKAIVATLYAMKDA